MRQRTCRFRLSLATGGLSRTAFSSKSHGELSIILATDGLWGGCEWINDNTWLCDRHGLRFAAELENVAAGEATESGCLMCDSCREKIGVCEQRDVPHCSFYFWQHIDGRSAANHGKARRYPSRRCTCVDVTIRQKCRSFSAPKAFDNFT
jgi:hypothetical protein